MGKIDELQFIDALVPTGSLFMQKLTVNSREHNTYIHQK